MRVLVFDTDKEDDSLYNEILSDTLLTLNDVIQMLRNDSDDYSVLDSARAIPFQQKFSEYCTGWYTDIRIETSTINSRCQLPTN